MIKHLKEIFFFQKIRKYSKKIFYYIKVFRSVTQLIGAYPNDTLAEWLRRKAANLISYGVVGSNPTGVD